jgi:hypothetical protein
MAFLLAVAVHNIGHPHFRTSTPYTRKISAGVEAEKKREEKVVARKCPQGVWGFCCVVVPIF